MKNLLKDLFVITGLGFVFIDMCASALLGAGHPVISACICASLIMYIVWTSHADSLKRQAERLEQRARDFKVKSEEADRIAREDYYARTGHRV